jgi:hypothetical protein
MYFNNKTMKQFINNIKSNTLTSGKKIIMFVVIVLVCFSAVYFIFSPKKELKNTKSNEMVGKEVSLPPKFSRITFFHKTKPICSLAIPESWEGKYRLQDSGDEAHFLYIQELNNPELFYVKKYQKNTKMNEIGERLILENENNFYTASLSTQNVDKFVNKLEFEKILKDLDEVLRSFKCF